jgi:archaellum biogenesis ATPase FlaH
MAEESEFVQHGPCESCGSSDARAVYTDGHAYCFSCADYSKGDGEVAMAGAQAPEPPPGLITGYYTELTKRGINEKTCRKFGYMVGTFGGSPVQIAPYHDSKGAICGQKLRWPTKDFTWTGESKQACLWGQQLWRDTGKMVVITEGEIDAMSISQLQDNRWPVVSLRNGAGGAKKDITRAISWLQGFDSVVLAFDTDDVGKQAALDVAPLLSPGKCKIWNIPLKDANAMLVAGRSKELLDGIWGAKVYRPDGIVEGKDTWDLLVAEDKHSTIDYPWAELQGKCKGLRVGEIVTFCAGSGVGKSQVCREITVHLISQDEKVGYIALEESVQRSIRGLTSILVNAPLHLPSARHKFTIGEEPRVAELKAAWDRIAGKVYFYDHWGSLDGENLFQRIRYLARACGCRWIVLDHISIVVSGDKDGDERRNIDNLMTKLRSMVEELQIGLILVSHLKRPDGKPLEEGGKTSLSLLRGSGSIGQLSDIVIGQERDQQDVETGNITTLRVLKNRFSGETGLAGELIYDNETGRLFPPGESGVLDGPRSSDY